MSNNQNNTIHNMNRKNSTWPSVFQVQFKPTDTKMLSKVDKVFTTDCFPCKLRIIIKDVQRGHTKSLTIIKLLAFGYESRPGYGADLSSRKLHTLRKAHM